MIVLALQTATNYGGVAVWDSNAGVLVNAELSLYKRLSSELAPGIENAISNAGILPSGIGLCAVTLGPGSFTGLRVGMAYAKGLSLATGCGVKAVPTLDVVVNSYSGSEEPVLAVLDARSERVYYAFYGPSNSNDDYRTAVADVIPIDDLRTKIADSGCKTVVGPDREFMETTLNDKGLIIREITAKPVELAKIAYHQYLLYGSDNPSSISPIYLKQGQV